MSRTVCVHGLPLQEDDGAECYECTIDSLRAKLKEAVGIAQKFAEAARDACIAGLAQSSKMRQYEDRIAELEAELLGAMREKEDVRRTATEDALRWAWGHRAGPESAECYINRGSKALLGEGEAK